MKAVLTGVKTAAINRVIQTNNFALFFFFWRTMLYSSWDYVFSINMSSEVNRSRNIFGSGCLYTTILWHVCASRTSTKWTMKYMTYDTGGWSHNVSRQCGTAIWTCCHACLRKSDFRTFAFHPGPSSCLATFAILDSAPSSPGPGNRPPKWLTHFWTCFHSWMNRGWVVSAFGSKQPSNTKWLTHSKYCLISSLDFARAGWEWLHHEPVGMRMIFNLFAYV